MTTEEHLKRVLSDLRAKERVANDEKIRAEAYAEAANVVEVELSRISRNTHTLL